VRKVGYHKGKNIVMEILKKRVLRTDLNLRGMK
jgi:hypothetical protein